MQLSLCSAYCVELTQMESVLMGMTHALQDLMKGVCSAESCMHLKVSMCSVLWRILFLLQDSKHHLWDIVLREKESTDIQLWYSKPCAGVDFWRMLKLSTSWVNRTMGLLSIIVLIHSSALDLHQLYLGSVLVNFSIPMTKEHSQSNYKRKHLIWVWLKVPELKSVMITADSMAASVKAW